MINESVSLSKPVMVVPEINVPVRVEAFTFISATTFAPEEVLITDSTLAVASGIPLDTSAA